MKSLALLFFTFLLSFNFFSQAPISIGRVQTNAGIGLASIGIPIYLGFDYGFKKTITLGGEVSYSNFTERFNNLRYKISMVGISANGNWHFNGLLPVPESINLYTGLNLSYYNWTYPADYMANNLSSIRLSIQVGGRYYFNPDFALNFELNGSPANSGSKFGITYKL